jgi:hypothetical protein
MDNTNISPIKILFLASDPSDAARLRLGQELREIREKLQLSKNRDRFMLEARESVRPGDITQAIFDVEPQIVHFSGHGLKTGELCFEDVLGKVQVVKPEALTALFELVADQVDCVVLNACHSETQADAIAEHIPFVIGMNDSVGDKAAIAFATGFYKALGANHSIEKAYKFGKAEIGVEGIPEHLTPVLYHRKSEKMKESVTMWLVEFKATLENLDEQQLEAIVYSLRQISGDASLTLQKVEPGSVRFFLEGSSDGVERIKTMHEKGQLKDVLGVPIQRVSTEQTATVRDAISPNKPGRVEFLGSWWSAKSATNVPLQPGSTVEVIGRQKLTLIVQPTKGATLLR